MIVGSFPATLETGNVISPEMYNVLRDAFKVQITQLEANHVSLMTKQLSLPLQLLKFLQSVIV